MKLHTWLPVICNMSITASAVILVILPIRLLLKKIPKIFSYLLWSVVLFRLLCPISVSSPFSLLGLFEDAATEKAGMEYIPAEFIYTDDGVFAAGGTEDAGGGQSLAGHKNTSVADEAFPAVIACIWVLGVAGILCFNGINFLRLKKRIVGAVCLGKNIYESDYIASPFVIGLFCPRIYVPASLTEQERYFILLHERNHIKRGDHIAKLLFFMALTIHWFNPLVWLAFRLAERDMEMSCDEMVIKQIDSDVRADYSKALLHLTADRKVTAGTSLAFGAGDIRERIKNIMGYRKHAIIIVGLAAVMVAGLMFVLGSNPKSSAQENNQAASKEIKRPDSGRLSENDLNSAAKAKNEDAVSDVRPENTFFVSVRSVSKSLRGIDTYVQEEKLTNYLKSVRKSGEAEGGGDVENDCLIFADGCIFKVNESMSGIQYKTVSFDDFAEYINQSDHYLNKPCLLKFSGEFITEICLQSAYYRYGIYSSIETDTADEYKEHQKIAGENFLERYYTLDYSVQEDIADTGAMETIEVYTGNIGDGESGYVLIKDKDGAILHNEFAHDARAGWNNIYIGKIEGKPFLLTVTIEDRDTYGDYYYRAFRLGEQGEIKLIASSRFEFGKPIKYNKKLFRKWSSELEYYLKASTLLLSTQEGSVRTEHVSEADKYNFWTLQP